MSKWIHSACERCNRTESISVEEAKYDNSGTLTSGCVYCDGELCYECHLLHECEGHKPEGFYCFYCGEVYEWHDRKHYFIEGDSYCQDCYDKLETKGELQ